MPRLQATGPRKKTEGEEGYSLQATVHIVHIVHIVHSASPAKPMDEMDGMDRGEHGILAGAQPSHRLQTSLLWVSCQ